jgi:hypothetical protein
MAEIETTVCGIPCIVKVLNWEPYVPAKTGGPPEYCYPAEGGYGDWQVCDRKGRPAPWLEAKMTDRDRNVLEEEIFNHMEGY